MTDIDSPTTMIRNSVAIDGREFLLAQHSDMPGLKQAAKDAVLAGAGYLNLTVIGNREVSILLTPGVMVLFESAEVTFDSRDTGDLAYPYDVAS